MGNTNKNIEWTRLAVEEPFFAEEKHISGLPSESRAVEKRWIVFSDNSNSIRIVDEEGCIRNYNRNCDLTVYIRVSLCIKIPSRLNLGEGRQVNFGGLNIIDLRYGFASDIYKFNDSIDKKNTVILTDLMVKAQNLDSAVDTLGCIIDKSILDSQLETIYEEYKAIQGELTRMTKYVYNYNALVIPETIHRPGIRFSEEIYRHTYGTESQSSIVDSLNDMLDEGNENCSANNMIEIMVEELSHERPDSMEWEAEEGWTIFDTLNQMSGPNGGDGDYEPQHPDSCRKKMGKAIDIYSRRIVRTIRYADYNSNTNIITIYINAIESVYRQLDFANGKCDPTVSSILAHEYYHALQSNNNKALLTSDVALSESEADFFAYIWDVDQGHTRQAARKVYNWKKYYYSEFPYAKALEFKMYHPDMNSYYMKEYGKFEDQKLRFWLEFSRLVNTLKASSGSKKSNSEIRLGPDGVYTGLKVSREDIARFDEYLRNKATSEAASRTPDVYSTRNPYITRMVTVSDMRGFSPLYNGKTFYRTLYDLLNEKKMSDKDFRKRSTLKPEDMYRLSKGSNPKKTPLYSAR